MTIKAQLSLVMGIKLKHRLDSVVFTLAATNVTPVTGLMLCYPPQVIRDEAMLAQMLGN